ncbi:MAG: hypothetical protein RLO17_19730 [Cyclobacteriaceae bacterium]
MKLKKPVRIFFIIFITLWLILTTFISYIFLKETWTDFLIEDSKSFIPLLTDDQINYENEELQFDQYFIETPFVERLENLEESTFWSVLQYELGVFVETPKGDNDEYFERFKTLYESWPDKLKYYAENLIYKVYVVDGLPSSGQIVSINDRSGFIILISESKMLMKPNDWATSVEELNFNPIVDNLSFRVIMEDSDDPILTFENILIHEIGHAVGVATELTPDFTNRGLLKTSFPFYEETYDEFVIRFKKKNKNEQLYARLHYYDTTHFQKLDFSEYKELLVNLEETSFPTTYSSRNHSELFAEMFYSYVHCVLQNKPYKYVVTRDNDQELAIENGIRKERCGYERSFIEHLFKTSPSSHN